MMVEDDEQNQQNQTPNPSNPTTDVAVGGGGGAGPLSGGTPSGSNPSTITPTGTQLSQNFATIQDYLKANQGQGQQLATQVTGKLSSDLSGEKGAIDTATSNAQNEITAGTTNYNPDLVSTAVNNPTQVTGNPSQLQDFLKQWNATYTGPSNFATSDTYAPAATAANEATNKAAETQDAGGQGVLLNQDFGVTGQGNQGLDVSLLENAPNYKDVQAFTPQFKGIQDYLTQQSNGVNAAAQAGQQASDAAKAQTQGAFSNELNTFQQSIADKTAADKAAATAQATQYQKDLSSGNVDAVTADLKAAGTPDATITNITDYLKDIQKQTGTTPDLSNFLIENPNVDVTPATAATPQDYSNAAAYTQLTGDTGYTSLLNPANAAQAGTWNTVNAGLNGTGIAQYLKDQAGQADKTVATTPITQPITGPNDIQNVLDATQRQGLTYANAPALQSIISNLRKTYTSPETNYFDPANSKLGTYQIVQTLENYLEKNNDKAGLGQMLHDLGFSAI